jgi:hypothetical protein
MRGIYGVVIEMGSGVMMYIPRFIKFGSGIQMLICGGGGMRRHIGSMIIT